MIKSFECWEFEELQLTFRLKRLYELSNLDEWFNAKQDFTEIETEKLNYLKTKLQRNAEIWNEEELKFFFLSQLIELVGYESELYKPFIQRKLSATIGDFQLNGVVDFMLATGIQNHRQPLFFIHRIQTRKKKRCCPLRSSTFINACCTSK